MEIQTTNLLKCPVEMINEPALVDAVKDYNKLTGVPLISNLNRTVTAVAVVFVVNVKNLTDEQADQLAASTIDVYNFLVTEHDVPDDFIPSVKVFPTDDEVQKMKEKDIKDAQAEMVKEELATKDLESIPAPSKPAKKSSKSKSAKSKSAKGAATEPTTEKPAASSKSRFEKFENPKSTTAVMMAIVDGATTADEVNEFLSARGLTSSASTISLMLSDVRKVLDYIAYKEQKGNGDI